MLVYVAGLLLRYGLAQLVYDSRRFLSENPFRGSRDYGAQEWYFIKARVSYKLRDDIGY